MNAVVANVERLLQENGVIYDWIGQEITAPPARDTSRRPASEGVLKSQLLIEDRRHALAILPKGRRLDLRALNGEFQRTFRVGTADDASHLYPGVPMHALLPAGLEAGTEIFIDQWLLGLEAIVLESPGDHPMLRFEGEALPEIFEGAWCAHFSRTD